MPAGQSTRVTLGLLNASQVLVVEAGALAQVPVVRLEDLGGGGIGHELLDPPAVLLHDPEVELLGARGCTPRSSCPSTGAGGGRRRSGASTRRRRGPRRRACPSMIAWKLSIRACCQPGSSAVGELGIGGPVAPHADRPTACAGTRRRASAASASGGQALDAGRAGADEPDDLVAELGERLARAAAGVARSPSGRCGTTCPAKSSMPGMAGSFRRLRIPTAST